MKAKIFSIFLLLSALFSFKSLADILPQDYSDMGNVEVYNYNMDHSSYEHLLKSSFFDNETQTWEESYKTIEGVSVKKYLVEYNDEIVTLYRKMPFYTQSGEQVYEYYELPNSVPSIKLKNGEFINHRLDFDIEEMEDLVYSYYTEDGMPAYEHILYDINGYMEIIFYTDELVLPKYNVTLKPDSDYYIYRGYWDDVAPVFFSSKEVNTYIVLPECTFVKEGYIFKHWTDEYNNYTPGEEYVVPTRDVMLRAVWERETKPEKDQYVVTFDSNGGTGSMESISWWYDLFFTLPVCEFEKEGYTFICWTDGVNNYYVGESEFIMPANDVTLTAMWEKKITYGDIQGDGEVSVSDAIYMLQLIALGDFSNITNDQIAAADVNGDGSIGVSDAIRILQHIANPNISLKP